MHMALSFKSAVKITLWLISDLSKEPDPPWTYASIVYKFASPTVLIW